MSTTNQVADTILQQLGGNRFIAMTGAKNFLAYPNALSMKIMPNSEKVTHVRITLDESDTYTITPLRIRGTNIITLRGYSMVHVEDLRRSFETLTGLRTSL